MGKPVVATKTEAMSVFAGHTYLAVTKEDYTQCIKRALDENNPALAAKRREFALTHTWTNSVNEIYKAIERIK
jgi:hypothetical protein